MFVQKCLKVNNNNNLEIGGCDCVELAKKFNTPLYVIDEQEVRVNCKKYKDAISKYYNGHGRAIYASKALDTMAILTIVEEEGFGVDVVSGGELYTAIKSGFPLYKVYFHGNNKTYDELTMAVENNVGIVIVDNLYELGMLDQIASINNKIMDIYLRISPGIDAHTHDYIKTGQIDSKFGIQLNNGEAVDAVKKAVSLKNINLVGLHCHLGSQIFETECFEFCVEVMMKFIIDVKNTYGIEFSELDLGGGFGISYVDKDDPIDFEKYVEVVSNKIKELCQKNSVKLPFIVFEPGRSIVGAAGITLYTIGAIKDIPGVRKYVSVDGGMGDNPRYALYQSAYDCVIANKPLKEKKDVVTVCGKYCESGDVLIKDIKVPQIESGDILAVLVTGAYNYSMSSNYNRVTRPGMVLVNNGKTDLIVKREDYNDLIRNDVVPQRLNRK